MAVKFIVIGKTKEKFFVESEGEYVKRLKKFVSFDYLTLDSSKNEIQASKVLQQEEKILLSRIKSTDFLILLDEKGMKFKNSTHFSQHLMLTLGQQKNVTFLVGGAFGFTDNIKKMAKEMWSLSPLTMPHHLVRTVFLEQLYRGFTIAHGGKYHND